MEFVEVQPGFFVYTGPDDDAPQKCQAFADEHQVIVAWNTMLKCKTEVRNSGLLLQGVNHVTFAPRSQGWRRSLEKKATELMAPLQAMIDQNTKTRNEELGLLAEAFMAKNGLTADQVVMQHEFGDDGIIRWWFTKKTGPVPAEFKIEPGKPKPLPPDHPNYGGKNC